MKIQNQKTLSLEINGAASCLLSGWKSEILA